MNINFDPNEKATQEGEGAVEAANQASETAPEATGTESAEEGGTEG